MKAVSLAALAAIAALAVSGPAFAQTLKKTPGGATTAQDERSQAAGTNAANTASLRRDQAVIDRNEAARADHARRVADYRRQEAEAEARQRQYERDLEAWRQRAAACRAGDRSQCGK